MFLHPEHYLDDYVTGGVSAHVCFLLLSTFVLQGYDQSHKYASQTTIYCHANDEALASAEILSRGRKCMGKHPFGYIRIKPEPEKPRHLNNRRGSALPMGTVISTTVSAASPHAVSCSRIEPDQNGIRSPDHFRMRATRNQPNTSQVSFECFPPSRPPTRSVQSMDLLPVFTPESPRSAACPSSDNSSSDEADCANSRRQKPAYEWLGGPCCHFLPLNTNFCRCRCH